MAVEAPISKFKITTLTIWIVVCLAIASWCAYDGYFSEKFIKDHTNPDGSSQTYLVFNRRAPAYSIGVAVLLGVYLLAIKNKKIVADENGLVIGKCSIAYDSIEKIDQTYFESKGFFSITYKAADGNEVDLKISDRKYDDLQGIVDELVAKIT